MEKQQRLAEAEATDRGEVYVPPAGKRARTKTESFPKIYQQDIMDMVEADTEIKWQKLIPALKALYVRGDNSLSEDFPKDGRIKAKLSYCKTKSKKSLIRVTL
ncbi:hypothetical protein SARC_06610 [Sphaeroforma arctica JP610]|uniref:Uncharacterized protein n=1 Tax=Sphaeroforma arctica JP610 TaxID=667725 RepID=A0A0L0FW31_9EUKA|nr:hypothetical protein SARC_06610 [Sphaeroforma arctica JP610]KNC81050.1 hypothetical protein SARC_06610 [Sphaeroforma arctica JP610]|eukprot:XP_014154952.1 hypothetical protein SARC_06610 [Sphaeroforma arctica JP610]